MDLLKARYGIKRKNFYYFWDDENIATLRAFEKILPIEIKNWQYGDRNDINFVMCCADEIKTLSGVRLLKYITNNYYKALCKGKYYLKPSTRTTPAKGRRSKIIMDNCCVLTGYHMDDFILEPIYKFLKHPVSYTNFEDLVSECLWAWVYACRDDYEYAYSDTALIEQMECNEYLFDIDGNKE